MFSFCLKAQELQFTLLLSIKEKHRAVPITRYGGLEGREMLRIQHCPDSRHIGGSEVVSLMH
jgi:hypothetical protein